MEKARIAHFRVPRGHLYARRYYRGAGFAFKGYTEMPDERGGRTTAAFQVGQKHYVGFAECSAKDSFCYRTGRTIALGRLRKALEPLGYGVDQHGNVYEMGASDVTS